MNIKSHDPNILQVDTYKIFKNKSLGMGQYSSVYKGICTDNEKAKKFNIRDNLVAIKQISTYGLSYKKVKRIEEETAIIKKLAELKHDNIIKCYEIINDIDAIYIVMEYCSGGDLSSIINDVDESQNNEELARKYFGQIVSGMDFLFKNKIIHRDVKPKNILLSEDKSIAKICDFGFAKIVGDIVRVETVCGSPLYMAPELISEKKYDETVDIWALGMVLYELLFGHHPFEKCKEIDELRKLVTNYDTKILKTLKISDECKNLLGLLLAKEPEKRIKLGKILDHEWFKANEEVTIKLIKPLSSYINYNWLDDKNKGDQEDLFEFEA